MRYFWWIISAVVLILVVLIMKFSFQPRIVKLVDASPVLGANHFADVTYNQMRAYFDHRKVIVLGLPVNGVSTRFKQEFARELVNKVGMTQVWILGAVIPVGPVELWKVPVKEARDWNDAGAALRNDLATSAKVLVITDPVQSYGLRLPGTFADELSLHYSYDYYLTLTLSPLYDFNKETLATDLQCDQATPQPLCRTDLSDAVRFHSRQFTKNARAPRDRDVVVLEQRAPSIFSGYVHEVQ